MLHLKQVITKDRALLKPNNDPIIQNNAWLGPDSDVIVILSEEEFG